MQEGKGIQGKIQVGSAAMRWEDKWVISHSVQGFLYSCVDEAWPRFLLFI